MGGKVRKNLILRTHMKACLQIYFWGYKSETGNGTASVVKN